MPSFSSAVSAHRNASLRACAMPRLWSREIWISCTATLLEDLMPLVFWHRRQPLGRIIEPLPVAALAREQRFEARHQFVVRGLRAEGRVIGLRHPLVIAAVARGGPWPAGAQLRIL